MMKKLKKEKGFTLIELLVTILLLSMISGLIISSCLSIIDNAKHKTYQTTVNNIEKMAAVYLKENVNDISFVNAPDGQYQCIKVKHLIDSGYFDNEILKSQVTDEVNVDPNMYVYVSRDNNTKVVKTAKLIYDNENPLNNHCKEVSGDADADIVFEFYKGWSKSKNVTIKYILSNITEQKQIKNYSYLYSINGEKTEEDFFSSKIITKNVTITSPSTIQAEINGNDLRYIEIASISKIDNDAPKIGDLLGDSKYEQDKSILVTIEESLLKGSGFNPQDKEQIVKYGWSKSREVAPEAYKEAVLTYLNCTDNTECQKLEFKVLGEDMTGEYYLWIEPTLQDIAGNVVTKKVSTGTYKFDNEKPIVNISRKNDSYKTIDSSQSTDNIGVTNYYYSKLSERPGENVSWGDSVNYEIISDGTYYVWAKDEAGNISEPKSIEAYKVTNVEGEGTTLKILYGSSVGEEIIKPAYVLEGTPIYIVGSLKTNYKDLVLKYNEEQISSKTTKVVNEPVNITSSATIVSYTINYYIGNGNDTGGAIKIGSSLCEYKKANGCSLKKFSELNGVFPYSSDAKSKGISTNSYGWKLAGWSVDKTPIVSYKNGDVFTYENTKDIDLYAVGFRTFNFYSGLNGELMSDKEQTQYWNPYGTQTKYRTSINVPELLMTGLNNNDQGWKALGYRATNDASSTVTLKPGTSNPSPLTLGYFDFRSIYERTIKITYNSNGGSGTVAETTDTQYYNSGLNKDGSKVNPKGLTISKNSFTSPNGKYFDIWNTKTDGTGSSYNSDDTYEFPVTAKNNVTLYGQWKNNSVKINLKENNVGASTTGYSVSLSTSSTDDTATFVKTTSGTVVSFDEVKTGITYYVWSGKSSKEKTTRIYSGISFKTVAGVGNEVTVNYYGLTLENGTGISAVSNGSTNETGKIKYLYNSKNPQEISIEATVSSGYTWLKWSKTSGTAPETFVEETNKQSIKMAAGSVKLKANATYSATPKIIRSDYNTFKYSATSGAAYYVSTNSAIPSAGSTAASSKFALNTWTTATSTGNLTLESGQTYYVWVKNKTTGGTVSNNKASIVVRKITRSQGNGTSLTTKYENSEGDAFTSTTYVLHDTPIYVSGSLKTGYNTLVLKAGTTILTSGNTTVITADTTISSSATGNRYTINYYLGNGTNAAGATKFTKTTSCTYGSSCTLEKFANLGDGRVYYNSVSETDYGWKFSGWSITKTGTERTYSDGQKVENLTTTNGGSVNLYAVAVKEFKFYSGYDATNGPKKVGDTLYQYWNPYSTNSSYLTELSAVIPTAIVINDGKAGEWQFIGYVGGNKSVNTNAIDIVPANVGKKIKIDYNVYGNMRSFYERTLTVSLSVKDGTVSSTKKTAVQRYESGINKDNSDISIPSFSLPTPTSSKVYGVFNGWSEKTSITNCDQYCYKNSYNSWKPSVDGNTVSKTLYAFWVYSYNANFYKNGSSIKYNGSNITSNSLQLSCDTGFVREESGSKCGFMTPVIESKSGYTIIGWGTSANSTTAAIGSNKEITLDANNTGRNYYALQKQNCSNIIDFLVTDSNSTKAECDCRLKSYVQGVEVSKRCDKELCESNCAYLEDGLYKDLNLDGRYIYRGSNPNNYIKFNDQTWRIISIETDGTYKIVYSGVDLNDTSKRTDIEKPYNSTGKASDVFTNTTLYHYLNDDLLNIENSGKFDFDDESKQYIDKHDFENGQLKKNNTQCTYNLSDIKNNEDNIIININVGLPNISDYYQASSNQICVNSKSEMINLEKNCLNNKNWMYLTGRGSDSKGYLGQWTLVSYSGSRIWHFEELPTNGIYVTYGGTRWNVKSNGLVTPVVYLKAGTKFTGSGTTSDPYVISNACAN